MITIGKAVPGHPEFRFRKPVSLTIGRDEKVVASGLFESVGLYVRPKPEPWLVCEWGG